ncbi:MAG: hypothetical protein K6G17_00910 [Oscillospiraceae bacterium]|nr:hypothetical protein [Oscillospiraceae bacterium]
MKKREELGKLMLEKLPRRYRIEREDVGEDARLAKSGMVFLTESYRIEGLGHLCVMRMKAMLGLMKMETVVLSVMEKDLPLFNLDWVSAFGKQTQIAELYDTQLRPYPQDALDAFAAIKARDADLEEPKQQKAHWYDDILYACSYHKSGKGCAERLNAAAESYIETYLTQAETAPACDAEAKREKVCAFAETLFREGGPAVDQVTKLFGPETARRLIVRHMYGV